jgi:hypothetical protein
MPTEELKQSWFKADFADSALQGANISSERLLGIDELLWGIGMISKIVEDKFSN